MNYSIQLSKDFKALKVWMTIKTFGYSKIQRSINNDIDMARYAYQIAKKDPLFNLYTTQNYPFFVLNIKAISQIFLTH